MRISTHISEGWVYRMPKEKAMIACLLDEMRVTRALRAEGFIKVPDHRAEKTFSGISYPFIKGDELTVETFTPEIAREIGRFLQKLHSLNLKLPPLQTPKFAPLELLQKWKGLEEGKNVVLHGDLSQHNILVEEGQLKAVIDFAITSLGPFWHDFHYIYRMSPELCSIALEEYGADAKWLETIRIDCLVDLYEKREKSVRKKRFDRVRFYQELIDRYSF